MKHFQHKNDGKIEYHLEGETLCYTYLETVRTSKCSYKEYKTEGVVPPAIVSQGDKAVKAYVEPLVEVEIGRQKEAYTRHKAFADNPNYPVETTHEGVKLKGRIVKASSRHIEVKLESPYVGSKHINYGFASAMAKRYVFDQSGGFSDSALETARKLLVDMYQQKKHQSENSDLYDLTDRLNSDNS